MIESADRIRVLNTIERHAKALSLTQEVLIQVNVSGEATKSGFTLKDAEDVVLQADRWPHVRIRGLMTMAPYEENPEKTRPIFAALRELLDTLKKKTGREDLNELSMGMTNNYMRPSRRFNHRTRRKRHFRYKNVHVNYCLRLWYSDDSSSVRENLNERWRLFFSENG